MAVCRRLFRHQPRRARGAGFGLHRMKVGPQRRIGRDPQPAVLERLAHYQMGGDIEPPGRCQTHALDALPGKRRIPQGGDCAQPQHTSDLPENHRYPEAAPARDVDADEARSRCGGIEAPVENGPGGADDIPGDPRAAAGGRHAIERLAAVARTRAR